MILFQCDYNEGAHPRIMERMMETNLEQSPGYGEDAHCRRAAQLTARPAEMTGLPYIFW